MGHGLLQPSAIPSYAQPGALYMSVYEQMYYRYMEDLTLHAGMEPASRSQAHDLALHVLHVAERWVSGERATGQAAEPPTAC